MGMIRNFLKTINDTRAEVAKERKKAGLPKDRGVSFTIGTVKPIKLR